MTARRLVIIGNGMAGARLAELVATRQRAGTFEISLFGEEPGGSYNRILLSGVLAGKYAGPDIVTHPVGWYAEHGITLHPGSRVARIDTKGREVITAEGERERFDVLVLATGSAPVVPPIEGLTAADDALVPGAFVFRTVDDCARMAVAASRATAAVVIGGGLLGLEAARGLLTQGVPVTVVHLMPHVMDAQLDPAGAQVLQKQLEGMGLRVMTSKTTTRIVSTPRVRGVEFSDGSRLSCDLLVIAAGVRPNVQLARDAGLDVRRGILIGDDLSCRGADEVYAIGDCVEHRGDVYGLVGPAWEQAEVLAARLTGRDASARYGGTRLATKLKVAGCDVAVMGERDADECAEQITYSEPSRGVYGRVLVRNERIAGAIVVGMPSVVPGLVQAFMDQAPVPGRRSDLLFPPVGDAPLRDVGQMSDSARICDCNAVTKAQIVDAVLGGARSLSAVCARTRAGTGCGSCRPEVQRVVDFVCRDVPAGADTIEPIAEGALPGGTDASL